MAGNTQRAPPVEELIGDIYDAALHPGRWPNFLGHLQAVQPDSFVLLGIIDRHPERSQSLGVSGLHEDAVLAYRNHFIRVNPWVEALSEAAPGRPLLVRDLADDAQVRRGEFFHDWLRHQSAQHPTSLLAPLADGRKLCLTVVHPTEKSARGDAPSALMRELAPHLVRAMQLSGVRELEPPRHDADATVLNMLSIGVIYTDCDCKVLIANNLAEEIVRSATGLRRGVDGRVGAVRPFDTERLQHLIRGAAESLNAGGAANGGNLSLANGSEAGRLTVLVAPLPHGAAGGSARVVVFVRRRDDKPWLDPAGLADTLDLTATEAAVAILLADGLSLAEIALRRTITMGTVRGQVKSVLAKTNTRSQADLVRLVMRNSFPLRG